jgi:hypothetical protein
LLPGALNSKDQSKTERQHFVCPRERATAVPLASLADITGAFGAQAGLLIVKKPDKDGATKAGLPVRFSSVFPVLFRV